MQNPYRSDETSDTVYESNNYVLGFFIFSDIILTLPHFQEERMSEYI